MVNCGTSGTSGHLRASTEVPCLHGITRAICLGLRDVVDTWGGERLVFVNVHVGGFLIIGLTGLQEGEGPAKDQGVSFVRFAIMVKEGAQ